MRGFVGLAVATLAVIASCTLFEDDIPDRSCTRDDQCFRAQGEVCDLDRKVCVERPDASTIMTFDAAVTP